MNCWSEKRIERAAMALVEAEALGLPHPADVVALARHTKECFRCRELFELFLETERSLQKQEQRKPLTLPLEEPVVSAFPGAERANDSSADIPYEMAADSTPPSERQPTTERLLQTPGGSLHVRVVPGESGVVAVAYLIEQLEDPTALLIGETAFAFDSSSKATLPVFPMGPLRLRIGNPL